MGLRRVGDVESDCVTFRGQIQAGPKLGHFTANDLRSGAVDQPPPVFVAGSKASDACDEVSERRGVLVLSEL